MRRKPLFILVRNPLRGRCRIFVHVCLVDCNTRSIVRGRGTPRVPVVTISPQARIKRLAGIDIGAGEDAFFGGIGGADVVRELSGDVGEVGEEDRCDYCLMCEIAC